jgi:hypothetical protein
MKMNQDLHDLQKTYVESLADVAGWTEKQRKRRRVLLWLLVRLLWPKIKELPTENEYRRYRITMTPAANIIGAIICGDHNATFHTGTGVLQTLTLVGTCSAITSQFRPGYALRKIQPEISFVKAVPIGASIIMTVRETRARGPLSVFELTARVEGSEEDLFSVPRILTMFKIPA